MSQYGHRALPKNEDESRTHGAKHVERSGTLVQRPAAAISTLRGPASGRPASNERPAPCGVGPLAEIRRYSYSKTLANDLAVRLGVGGLGSARPELRGG